MHACMIKSILPFSKLIIGKSQLFTACPYMYLHGNTQIRDRGRPPPLVLIGLNQIMVITMMDSDSDSDSDFLGSCYKEGVSCGSKGKGGQRRFVS